MASRPKAKAPSDEPQNVTRDENALVRYSRAGDKFHYRWAARRCLRMIDPRSPLQCITIEGSKESKAAGEYVIDVAEYPRSSSQALVGIYALSAQRSDSRHLAPWPAQTALLGAIGGHMPSSACAKFGE